MTIKNLPQLLANALASAEGNALEVQIKVGQMSGELFFMVETRRPESEPYAQLCSGLEFTTAITRLTGGGWWVSDDFSRKWEKFQTRYDKFTESSWGLPDPIPNALNGARRARKYTLDYYDRKLE